MKLLGCQPAAQLLGLSPQLLRYRAEHGHGPRVARYSPLRFRLAEVLAHREVMASPDPRKRERALAALSTSLTMTLDRALTRGRVAGGPVRQFHHSKA